MSPASPAATRRTVSLRILPGTLCLLLVAAAWGDAPRTNGLLEWRGGAVPTPQQDAAARAAVLAETRAGARHFLVQFDHPVTPADHAALDRAGLTLLTYVGDNAFFAGTAAGRDPAPAAQTPGLRCILPIEPAWKLHPDLAAGTPPPWALQMPPAGDEHGDVLVAVIALFHPDVAAAAEGLRLAHAWGGQVRTVLRSVNALVIELPQPAIAGLAAEDAVQWLEPPLPPLTELNDSNRARVGADLVQAPPYGLVGTGVNVLVYDGGTARPTHLDFQGRLFVRDSSGQADHSTHVAGTIGGAGVANPLYRGMAPAVTMQSYGFQQVGGIHEGFLYTDPGDIEADYGQAILTHGVDIANNSIGTNVETNGYSCAWQGDYCVTDTVIDAVVRGSVSAGEPFRIVWANGNERQGSRCDVEGQGDYYSTAPPATAKNHVAVGAINSNDDSMTDFSSWGPVDDGRLKPDIVAPGCQSDGDLKVTSCSSSGDDDYAGKCGTSMASPTVCGLGALLLQDFRLQYPGEPDFRNSTLKVLLAHTAVDLGNPGPDYQFGYGSVRIQPAVDLLRSGNFAEQTVAASGVYSTYVIVAPGDPQLKATLAWDDVPGTPNVSPALVNDLDLRVFDPNNVEHFPWTLNPASPATAAVRTQGDHANNIEQVVIDNPPPGAYRLEVRGFNVPQGPQTFSLAATPFLTNCSSTGDAALDRGRYTCAATAVLRVVDCDLNTSNDTTETVLVSLASTSEPAGESVILTETTPESAVFLADVPLSTTDAAGVLWVASGDTVTLTYNDAADAGGQPAVATDTAVVDCTGPVIANIAVAPLNPRDATITFTTDEPALTTVRYGLACDNLAWEQPRFGIGTNHAIPLAGLTDGITYYYVIEAADEAGNVTIADNGGACLSFETPDVPDFFTELFIGSSDLNDLDFHKLTFAPNGSLDFYAGCAEPITALPTDPAGGTPLSFSSGDDGYAVVTLAGGEHVWLYGVSYGSFWVGTNGYLTFAASDIDSTESLTDQFEQPRISGLFDNLRPNSGGVVSWQQLADRVVVTWLGVPEYGQTNENTFQIEMFFDGRITLSYLTIAANDGLAGLSAGTGVPVDYFESDLSSLSTCGPRPPLAHDVFIGTAVDVPVTITLSATDDGLPDPPAALTYTITSLPGLGTLTDPQAGAIASAPYTLAGGGNQVIYTPAPGMWGSDGLIFRASDGGTPPEGGDSNEGDVLITVGGPAWDPQAGNVSASTPLNTPVDVVLNGYDPNGDLLTFVILSLPAQGELRDPLAGLAPITAVPYALADYGNVVRYVPPHGVSLVATFTFQARDATWGSNIATAQIEVGGPQAVYTFALDSNPGWATEGAWAFGQPTGQGGTQGAPDPLAGHTGLNVYGYNLSGGYTNNLPRRYLTTTALNLRGVTNVELRFWRWLGVESGTWDHAGIEVSNDGLNWTSIWEHSGVAVNDAAWVFKTYSLAGVADNQPSVLIRWAMGTTDGAVTYCGWNIDDVEIWGLVPPVCRGDCDCDGNVGFSDIDYFVAAIPNNETAWAAKFPGGPTCRFVNCDVNGNGTVGFDDIDPFVALIPSVCP